MPSPPAATTPLLLLLLMSFPTTTLATSPRVVVTFHNASLNAEAAVPESATVVKQYGRRLVLRLVGQETDELPVEEWVQEALGGEEFVERVELDAVATGGGGCRRCLCSALWPPDGTLTNLNPMACTSAPSDP
jgi:hypothetical protein